MITCDVAPRRCIWLRTNRVSTNGAAAKVMNFAGLEKGTPLHPGDIFNRSTNKSVKNMKFAVTPFVLTPCVPFRYIATAIGGTTCVCEINTHPACGQCRTPPIPPNVNVHPHAQRECNRSVK